MIVRIGVWALISALASAQGVPQQAGAQRAPSMAPERVEMRTTAVEVPMRMRGPMPAVDVKVNGKGPFLFAIDTGGQGAARADAALVAKLALPVIGKARGSDGSGNGVREMDIVQMESIDVGGVTFFGVPAPSRDYNDGKHEPIDGILGFGLFADLLLTLDYPRKVVRIERGALPAADGAEILDYSGERGVPAIDITVGGVAARARLDSGNMIGMIVPAAMAEKLELESKPVSAGRAKTVTSDVEITRATLAGSVRIGRHELQRPELTFVGLSDVANVGSPVMASFAVTFDQKNHRVRFRRG